MAENFLEWLSGSFNLAMEEGLACPAIPSLPGEIIQGAEMRNNKLQLFGMGMLAKEASADEIEFIACWLYSQGE
jgi:hypothetical protein